MVINIDATSVATPMTPKYVTMEADGQVRKVRGRPVQFNQKAATKDMKGADGNPIVATLYESQCPFCCLKLSFAGDLKSVQCPHCERGRNVLEFDEFINPFCKSGEFDRQVSV